MRGGCGRRASCSGYRTPPSSTSGRRHCARCRRRPSDSPPRSTTSGGSSCRRQAGRHRLDDDVKAGHAAGGGDAQPAGEVRGVDYWASSSDWRTHEAAINTLPSRFADIDGTLVHYLRFDAERGGALPIVLTNGWPSTFLELTDLARRLAAPSQYGGNPQDAFT
jgi:Epoxide hydrolase N terminus